METKILLLMALLVVCSIRAAKKLPAHFPRCYRDDPDINDCLLKATKVMKPYLRNGIPELNIPSLSPFFIPEIVLQQGTNAVNYKATLRNIELVGLDNYEFARFDYDVKNNRFHGELNMGTIELNGEATMSGKILTVPIEGNGKFKTTVLSSNGTMFQTAKLVTRKQQKYLEPVETIVKINVGNIGDTKFEGLFDGNQQLQQAVRDVVNENLRELVEEVKPAVEEVMTKIIVDILLKSIYKVPYDELYPKH